MLRSRVGRAVAWLFFVGSITASIEIVLRIAGRRTPETMMAGLMIGLVAWLLLGVPLQKLFDDSP